MLGFSPLTTLLVPTIAGLQFVWGLAIASLLRLPDDSPEELSAGIAIIVGGIAWVGADQLLLWLFDLGAPARTCAGAAVTLGVLLPRSRRELSLRRASVRRLAGRSGTLSELTIIGLGLILIGHDRGWTAPAGAVVALTGLTLGAKTPPGLVQGLRITLAFAAALVIRWRVVPDAYWYLEDDFGLAWVMSISQWGPATNPLAFGVPTRYHWLSYAWFGSLAAGLPTQALEAIRIAGPLILGYAILMMAIGAMRIVEPAIGVSRVLIGAIFLCLAGTVPLIRGRGLPVGWTESSSQLFGVAAGVATIFVVMLSRSRRATSLAVCVAGLVAGVYGAKVTAGLATSASMLLVCGTAMLRDRTARRLIAARIVGTVIGSILGIIGFSEFAHAGGTWAGVRRTSWPITILGDLGQWYHGDALQWYGATATLILALALPATLLLAIASSGLPRGSGWLSTIVTTQVGFSVLLLMVPLHVEEVVYSIGSSVAAAWIVSSVAVSRLSLSSPMILTACGVALTTLAIRLVEPELSNGSALLWWRVSSGVMIVVAAFVVAVTAWLLSRRHLALTGLLTAGLAASVVTLGTHNMIGSSLRDHREWQAERQGSSIDDSPALAVWLESIPADAVIASDALTFGPLLGRRDLAALPPTVWYQQGRAERVRAVLDFRDRRDCDARDRLRELGATHFVSRVDLTSSAPDGRCSPSKLIRSSEGREVYVVYDLAKAP